MKRGSLYKAAVLVIIFLFSLFSIVSASELKVTQDHPFLVDGRWVEAKELNVGDVLFTAEGKKVRITGIEDVFKPTMVYNIEDLLYSNYILRDGLVVHNSNQPQKAFLKKVEIPEPKPENIPELEIPQEPHPL